MKAIEIIMQELENVKARSAWGKGVKEYAAELLEGYAERTEYEGRQAESPVEFKEWLLNGAENWQQFSWGGSSLIYNGQIAARLCTATELKQTRNGERRPNSREEWLDTQARALYQAERMLIELL